MSVVSWIQSARFPIIQKKSYNSQTASIRYSKRKFGISHPLHATLNNRDYLGSQAEARGLLIIADLLC